MNGLARGPIAVIGAGVIGLSCAYVLRKRGADVVVLDYRAPGLGASCGNGGWVSPSLSGPVPAPGLTAYAARWALRPDSPLHIRPRLEPEFLLWLWRFWRKCNPRDYARGLDALARLNTRTLNLFDALACEGVRFEMHDDGLLFLFRTQAAAEKEARDLRLMEPYGYPAARWLDPAALRREEPAVSDGVVAGILAPAERHVRPESLVAGLVDRLREMDVPVESGERVLGFERHPGRVSAVRTSRRTLDVSRVVIAAGAESGRLGRALGVRLPVEAGKGYSVTLPAPTSPPRRPLYCTEARVGCSPFHGALRILGTMELSGINEVISPTRVHALLAAPARYLRSWDVPTSAASTGWVGMRPMTPDGLPIIGALPAFPNVTLATGHAMLGVTLAPATAEAVADLITGRPDHALLHPFRADRF